MGDKLKQHLGFLKQPVPRILTVILLLQITLYQAVPKTEQVPLVEPLKQFPAAIGGWVLEQEGVIDEETQNLLKANDTLNRFYAGPGGAHANLFIAFFQSQRAGASPHSPKVCLPGSGWTPTNAGTIPLAMTGRTIQVNRYTVAKGEQRSVVLYWYQSRERVVASEYWAKLYSMYDSIRYRRSDTSLVRIVVPVLHNDESAAEATAIRFAQDLFQPIREFLPS